jgi:phenylacetate-CoA ligase
MAFNGTIKKLLRYPYSLLPYKYRLHNSYFVTKNIIKNNLLNKKSIIDNYKLKKLREILQYSYKHCPGYFQLFKEASIEPKDLKKLSDIEFFPYITKELLRDNLKDFTSRDKTLKKKFYVTTSGSTGVPFGFYNTKEENATELAFIHNAWEAIGWKLGDSSIVLRGAYIGSKDKLSYFNPSTNELHISSYYLQAKNYKKLKEIFLKKKILDIQAFPSAAINLSNLIIENNDIRKINFRFFFLGSENFTEWQEKQIKKAFPDSTILTWYGHTEKCALAVKYPKNNFYNICDEYGFTEIYANNKNKIKKFFKKEIVSTSYFVKATPFIRYRTSDFASGELNKDGSINKIYKIDGRKQEFIFTKSKKKIYISSWASILHNDIFDKIKEFQFHQKKYGKVILNIVPKKNFEEQDRSKMYNQLKKKFENDLDIQIIIVSDIGKSLRNKHAFIKNDIITS